MNQKVLITGGTGFVGLYLTRLLLQLGSEVHITGFSQPEASVQDSIKGSQFHQLDLTQKSAVESLIKLINPDQIYHLAALSSNFNSFAEAEKVLLNNVSAQLNLLEAARQFAPQARILCVGSAEVYGQSGRDFELIPETAPLKPVSPYGVSKATQEHLALMYFYSYGLQTVVVRPFNHIGPGQTDQFVVSAFAKQIVAIEKNQQTEIKVGNLDVSRDFSDVEDVVKAYALLMQKGQAGEVYNIGSGQPTRISDLLDMLIKLSGQNIKVEVDPARFRPVDIPLMVGDIGKIKALGWQPQIPLATTLGKVLNWWREKV